MPYMVFMRLDMHQFTDKEHMTDLESQHADLQVINIDTVNDFVPGAVMHGNPSACKTPPLPSLPKDYAVNTKVCDKAIIPPASVDIVNIANSSAKQCISI